MNDESDGIPDGMRFLWTIEKPMNNGILIDDLKDTQEGAAEEIEKRGSPWTTARIVVPYKAPRD
jgi:hypothetical protein